MPNTPKSALFDEFADDLLQERSIRPLIIVGASKIDQLLLQILDSYLLPKNAKASDPDELLEGDRPLSTFSSRIKICYRLGLIDKTLFNAIEKVRALRNPSAHSIGFDIAKSPIREHLANLRSHVANRQSFKLTKDRYFDNAAIGTIEDLQCSLLTLCVLLEAIREKTKQTRGSKIALTISRK